MAVAVVAAAISCRHANGCAHRASQVGRRGCFQWNRRDSLIESFLFLVML
jgi:hypothetical protein